MSKKLIICPVCSGSGKIPEGKELKKCNLCKGEGRVWEKIEYLPYKG